MQRLDRLLKPLFWLAVLFAFVCAIMPASEAPQFSSSDKVEHIVTFVFLAAFATVAWRTSGWWRIALPLAGFGALIEFTQAIPALHRDADIHDWLADCGGILVGILIGLALRPLARRLFLDAVRARRD